MSFLQTLLELNGQKVVSATKRIFAPKNRLFDGDDRLFKSVARNATSYAEYGCGASTIWVSANTNARIIAVDTSRAWIDAMATNIDASRADLRWIDCGDLRKWGVPVGYQKRANFGGYSAALWIG